MGDQYWRVAAADAFSENDETIARGLRKGIGRRQFVAGMAVAGMAFAFSPLGALNAYASPGASTSDDNVTNDKADSAWSDDLYTCFTGTPTHAPVKGPGEFWGRL